MNIAIRGDHENRHGWFGIPPVLKHLETIVSSEPQVTNDKIDGIFECSNSLGAIAGSDGAVALGFEHARKRFSLPILVFYHKDSQRIIHWASLIFLRLPYEFYCCGFKPKA